MVTPNQPDDSVRAQTDGEERTTTMRSLRSTATGLTVPVVGAGSASSTAAALSTEGVHIAHRARRHGDLHAPAKPLAEIDRKRILELIEGCRAHAVSVAELADVTSQALSQCYEYEEHDPHLGQCCKLVGQVVEDTKGALALTARSADGESWLRAEEVSEACELELDSLTCAMHVVRAISSIVGTLELNHHDHILLALHDLESGIRILIDGLGRVIPMTPAINRPAALYPGTLTSSGSTD